MNDYFFDRARAVDREYRIREASEQQQLAMHHTHKPETPETIVIRPHYRRSFAISTLITIVGIVLLFLIATPTSAQGFEPHSADSDVYGEAFYIFTMGNVAYVRENYQESVDLFQESIDMIPVVIFEQMPDYAHMYYFLGRSQLANGEDEAALESFTLYVEYSQGEALPEIIDYVKASVEIAEIPDA